jgi:hypothetical protein
LQGKAALALKDANTARLLEEFLLLSADVSLTTQPDANGVIAALNEVVVEMLRKVLSLLALLVLKYKY